MDSVRVDVHRVVFHQPHFYVSVLADQMAFYLVCHIRKFLEFIIIISNEFAACDEVAEVDEFFVRLRRNGKYHVRVV